MASPEAAPARRLRSLCRLILNFRLVALLVTVAYVGEDAGAALPIFLGVVAGGLASYLPLKLWDRVGPVLVRRPEFLAVDMVVAMTLLALIGPQSPFLLFTLGTALMAGVLHGRLGAAVFSVLLLALYYTGLWLRLYAGASAPDFQTLVGGPVLYPLAAMAGAEMARLLRARAEAETALAAAGEAAAVERERTRIARDMHDSLAKTLHGISLQSAGLETWTRRDPERARVEARAIATAASIAAGEAREIIRDLRTDDLEEPLDRAVERYVERWAAESGLDARTDTARAGAPVDPTVRWELFSILREALDNVARHAEATSVQVDLERVDGHLRLAVVDDGRGLEEAAGGAGRQAAGHFGLVGMRERAQVVGGSLEVAPVDGGGTVVEARVPLERATAAPGQGSA